MRPIKMNNVAKQTIRPAFFARSFLSSDAIISEVGVMGGLVVGFVWGVGGWEVGREKK